MRQKLLDFLRCPNCRGVLNCRAELEQNEEIIRGILVCRNGCGQFPIAEGIPRLLKPELAAEIRDTAQRFGLKWRGYSDFKGRYEQGFLDWIAPVSRDFFKGKIVLDAGCGHGQHAYLAANFGAEEVVAVDLSIDAAKAAYQNTRHLSRVNVVQADIYNLPFSRAFDYIYAIGVLHHLPDPSAGFKSLLNFLKKKGWITAWVYSRENNQWIIRTINPLRKKLTSKMSIAPLSAISFLLTLFLYPLVHFLYKPANRLFKSTSRGLFYNSYLSYIGNWNFRETYYCVLDHLLPPVAFYISRDEFAAWFTDNRLEQVSIRFHNSNSWSGSGRYLAEQHSYNEKLQQAAV